MNPIWFEVGIAAIVVVASVTVVIWIVNHKASRTEWRMYSMMQRVGVDTVLIEEGDMETTMKAAHERCQKCRSGHVCDQWLAGSFDGGNTFCPNARVFRTLAARHQQVAQVSL